MALLSISLFLRLAFNNVSRRLAVDVGGEKRLHALSTLGRLEWWSLHVSFSNFFTPRRQAPGSVVFNVGTNLITKVKLCVLLIFLSLFSPPASAVILAPWAVIISYTKQSMIPSTAILFPLLSATFLVYVFDYYMSQVRGWW